MKGFLVKNTRKDDLNMFADMANETGFEKAEDVPLTILLPAFITSELKTAFQIGFLLCPWAFHLYRVLFPFPGNHITIVTKIFS